MDISAGAKKIFHVDLNLGQTMANIKFVQPFHIQKYLHNIKSIQSLDPNFLVMDLQRRTDEQTDGPDHSTISVAV